MRCPASARVRFHPRAELAAARTEEEMTRKRRNSFESVPSSMNSTSVRRPVMQVSPADHIVSEGDVVVVPLPHHLVDENTMSSHHEQMVGLRNAGSLPESVRRHPADVALDFIETSTGSHAMGGAKTQVRTPAAVVADVTWSICCDCRWIGQGLENSMAHARREVVRGRRDGQENLVGFVASGLDEIAAPPVRR